LASLTTGRRPRCCRPLAATARPACCWLGMRWIWPPATGPTLTCGCFLGIAHPVRTTGSAVWPVPARRSCAAGRGWTCRVRRTSSWSRPCGQQDIPLGNGNPEPGCHRLLSHRRPTTQRIRDSQRRCGVGTF